MTTNWDKVSKDAIAAAKSSLGNAWAGAAQGAVAQVGALVHVANYIDDNKARMKKEEYEFLMGQQKTALQNVLTAYKAIDLAAAQNAVAAAVSAIIKGVPSLAGLI